MNSPLESPAPRRSWARRLVNVLVAIVVIAVAAAAFIFSYDGVRAFALLGGMSTQLARYYPALFDAVLVIACLATAVLHNGRWWARLWAWLVALVLLAAIGAADVSHAAGYTLRHRPTEAVVAGAPVVAVLLAFSLLLTLLRQSRTPVRATVVPADRGERLAPPAPAELPALPAGAPVRVAGRPIALPAAPRAVEPAAETALEPAPEPAEEPVTEPGGNELTNDGTTNDGTTNDEPADDGPTDDADLDSTHLDGPVLESPLPRRRSSDYPVPGREARDASLTPPDGLPVLRPVTESAEATAPAEGTAPAEPQVKPERAVYLTAAERAAYERESAAPAPAATTDPAPPTAPVRALTVEPEPARRGIRYANGVPGVAGHPQEAPVEPEPEPPASSAKKWDADGGSPYAGLVYSAHNDSAGEPRPWEVDEDAPPFATAPFAAIPRLNRVRSMPAPPADDEDEDDGQ